MALITGTLSVGLSCMASMILCSRSLRSCRADFSIFTLFQSGNFYLRRKRRTVITYIKNRKPASMSFAAVRNIIEKIG